jgi:hypothetical protein
MKRGSYCTPNLVTLFGPHLEWDTSSRPGRGLDEQYDLFCEDFAKTIGAKSGNAVKHQVSFALPLPDGATLALRSSI